MTTGTVAEADDDIYDPAFKRWSEMRDVITEYLRGRGDEITYYEVRLAYLDADGNRAWLKAVMPNGRRSDFGVASDATLIPCSALTSAGRHCLRLADADEQLPGLPPWLAFCVQHTNDMRSWELEQERDEADRHEKRAREHRRLDEERARNATVYYVQRADGLIKIGHSKNFRARFLTLQREHGALRILATHKGGARAEKIMHEAFHDCRVIGEWFSPCEPLLRHVERIVERELRRSAVA